MYIAEPLAGDPYYGVTLLRTLVCKEKVNTKDNENKMEPEQERSYLPTSPFPLSVC